MIKIKVCGLTTVDDALACARAGVDWIGLNFHPGSLRCLEPSLAAEIVAALPPSCEPVGLFVDRPPAEVVRIAERVGLEIVQLHGNEPPEDLVALGSLRVVRAFRLRDRDALDQMLAYLDRATALGHGRGPDAILVDAYVAGQAGGTGHSIDSELLDLLSSLALPHLVLAGGLNPTNVAHRVARVRPWMVDVASGVEWSPGRKDPSLIDQFVRATRGSLSNADPLFS